MKKILTIVLLLLCTFTFFGCQDEEDNNLATYKVTFVTQTIDNISDEEVKENGKIPVPPAIEKENHEFLGWFDQSGVKWDFNVNTVTEDITLTAHWRKLGWQKHLLLDEFGNYGGTTNKSKYGMGSPLNGEYDQLDSPYFLINDYYYMNSTKTRTILPKFAPYQQTMQDSGGLACALMILNYEGKDVESEFTEIELVKKYEQVNKTTVYGNGTTAEGLKAMFSDIGYTASANAFVDVSGTTEEKIASFSKWVKGNIELGKYLMVRFQDNMEFGWHIIVGHDDMGTEFAKDDVLIMADPYDNSDHCQDGYYTSAAGRFYRWWQNMELSGHYTNQFDCLLVNPKSPTVIVRVDDDDEPTQQVPELHLLLNDDGSYGGTRDAAKYGTINEKNGQTDHKNAHYHKFVDYYNMRSNDTRYILTGYRAFQQTMASSCGICSVLSVLSYYGEDIKVWDEVFLVDRYEAVTGSTVKGSGVGSAGLRNMLNTTTFGYTATARSFGRDSYVNNDSRVFQSYEQFLAFVKTNLAKGTPIPISWRPHGGHWEVIIAIDDMGTDYIYDDVLVLADSHDTFDHYQDGYNTYPATLFFRQWYNGSFTWNQQYVVFDKKSA